MVGQVGRNLAVHWGNESPQPRVAGVREKSVEMAGEPVDVTNDDSAGQRELIDAAQVSTVNISVSGIVLDDVLRADWFAGNGSPDRRYQNATFRWPVFNPANASPAPTNGARISGLFYLSEFTETGPHDDATTFEATFMSAGPVTYTPES